MGRFVWMLAAWLGAAGCGGEPGGAGTATASAVAASDAWGGDAPLPECRECRLGALTLQKTADLEPGEQVYVGASGVARVRYDFQLRNTGEALLHDVTLVDRNGPDGEPRLVCLVTEGHCEYRPFTADALAACRFPLSAGDGWGCLLETEVRSTPSPFPSFATALATDECLQPVRDDAALLTPTVGDAGGPPAKPALTVDVSSDVTGPLCLSPGATASVTLRFTASNPGGAPLDDVLLVDERALALQGASQFLRLYVCPTGPDTCAFLPAAPENEDACAFPLGAGMSFRCAFTQQVTSNVLSFADQLTATARTPKGRTLQASDAQTVTVNAGCPSP